MGKQLTDEDKLRILLAAIEADDIRPLLAAEKLKRGELASLADEALDDGLLTGQDFDWIKQAIERPKSFPTDPEQRIDSLLSGVVNIEPKQILTLLLDDNPRSIGDLREGFVEATSGVWAPRWFGKNIEQYLLQSLDPVGFVAHPVLQDLDVQHKATEAGKRYGQPIAAYVLDLGRQTNFSFYQLFGSTNSTGDNRAPYNRFRILEMLLEKDRRIADFEEQLNLASHRVHLKALRKLGFVEFDSVSLEERGWAVYRWGEGRPENVETVKGCVAITHDVADWLFKNKEGDCHQIADDLKKRVEYRNWKESGLISNVSNILAGLKEQGFATAYYQGGKELSHAKLVRDNRCFVEEFTRKVRDALQDGTELEAMRRIHQQYQDDPDRFRLDATRRLQIYVEISPGINARSPQEWTERILAYVASKGEVRARAIKRDVASTATNYLSVMADQGFLNQRKKGNAVFYSVNPAYRPVI